MGKILSYIPIALALVSFAVFLRPAPSLCAEERLSTVVVEFEEKENTGIELVSRQVSERLVLYLQASGLYAVAERPLAWTYVRAKRPDLPALAVRDTTVAIGQVFGYRVVVIGSITKIDNRVIIIAEAVNVDKRTTVAHAKVEFFETRDMDDRVHDLAGQIIRGERRAGRKTAERPADLMLRHRIGFRLGTGYLFNDTRTDDSKGFAPLAVGAFYNGPFLDVELFGITPPTNAALLSGAINAYPTQVFGVGLGYFWIYDHLELARRDRLLKEYHKGEYQSAVAGVVVRAPFGLKVSFYVGFPVSGTIDYQDEDNAWYRYDIRERYQMAPPSLMGFVEYRFNEYISVRASYHQGGGGAEIRSKPEGSDPFPTMHMDTKIITVSVGYGVDL